MNTEMPVELQAGAQQTLKTFLNTIQDTEMSALNDNHLQQWLKVLLCSNFVTRQLIHQKQAIVDQWIAGDYFRAFAKNEMAEKLNKYLQDIITEEQLLQVLRHFRQQQMVRICWRDINDLADLDEVMQELSELADSSIICALNWLDRQQQKDFGTPLDKLGQLIPLIVIGMGKLGARELNFSSDIDLIFAFSEHGETVNGSHIISHNEYFIKLGQSLIKALNLTTQDGFVFRVDMRLRPFGQSGPLVMTFDALENYYATHGRDWERYAMIKARAITGSKTDQNTIHNLLKPFIYRRYTDFGVFESLRGMKSMLAREVTQKKKEHNIKLGTGGIREIEFLAQTFQLLKGGHNPNLQDRRVKKILTYLGSEQSLLPESAADLLESYNFLRKTEHRLQQVDDKQTHNLPENNYHCARIAYGMGYADWNSFLFKLQSIRDKVQRHFEQSFHIPHITESEDISDDMKTIWQARIDEKEAAMILNQCGYRDGFAIIHLLTAFKNSHRYHKISREGNLRLDRLMPLLLNAVALVDDSETAFKRILDVIESICRRSVYIALLVENPLALSQLVKLCAASSWIARLLRRFPVLFDELLDARVLYAPLQYEQLFQKLKAKMATVPSNDLERTMEGLHYFKQSHSLRIAAADVVHTISVMKVSDYLSWLAEAILHFALQTAWHNLTMRYGYPQESLTNKESSTCKEPSTDKTSPYGFAIIGFGKMGGIELGYRSDLDLVFIFADCFSGGITDAAKPIDNLQFYSKLSLRIMHILQTQSHSGILYEADMRLRPNGHSGLITTSLKAFRNYEMEKAWTWEHQALVRARFIAGDKGLSKDFVRVRKEVLGQYRQPEQLKKQVCEMRKKMHESLLSKRKKLVTKKGCFDLKYDSGGIADIEFIVQYLVLKNSHNYPQLLNWTDNIRILETLAQTALLAESVVEDLIRFYQNYRERCHHLSLQEVPCIVAEHKFRKNRKKIQQHWQQIME
ncbi:MAG: bifunctional [glutamate--ammonia ligase]-adenylyl-L-tyrosine phosphorylase/[glutamate--ammonia-ligase] adenylyltransferase [gamma proteobacterium symbiont of Taylorina sp.]|nr:bifunctional [glutamate--ammonia ligase]-adenylyl-L-tyrosine phosphorylase/[glutamate--ammonia-ligase] adenylyltransferase [gamma proteobacterium symbiont of Taylorina sp.]